MAEALVVEDDHNTLAALTALVKLEGFEVRSARNLAEARRAIEQASPDVVLSDLLLPDGRGTELLTELREDPSVEVILITGNATVETAVESLRLGAYDYLTKPVDEARLKTVLTGVARTRELKFEISSLRQELRRFGRFGSMVGTSKAMQEVYDLLERVAATDATVFLVGESGTGKELAAATLHKLSRRRQQPFVAVNCGAVSATLIESELFGHERGAFTGANRQHQGYFEQAHHGTLFLDEVTEMPPDLQVKLLRVLETGKVTRVGGVKPNDIDVRIVTATNRDPAQAVAAGDFREDLLYRLNVFPVVLPPLSRRSGDVELLVRHFLAQLNDQADIEKDISKAALEALDRYPWPGNVRELKNVVQRAHILADEVISTECLSAEIRVGVAGMTESLGGRLEMRVGMSIAEAERRLIESTLEELEGDKKRASELLGVSLKTLYNRLNAYQAEDG